MSQLYESSSLCIYSLATVFTVENGPNILALVRWSIYSLPQRVIHRPSSEQLFRPTWDSPADCAYRIIYTSAIFNFKTYLPNLESYLTNIKIILYS